MPPARPVRLVEIWESGNMESQHEKHKQSGYHTNDLTCSSNMIHPFLGGQKMQSKTSRFGSDFLEVCKFHFVAVMKSYKNL